MRFWPARSSLVASLAIAAILLAAVPESLAAKGRPQGVVNRRGYPKLAVLRSGGAPTDPVALEALHRNWALADIIVFQGNRGKWWTLPNDASGFNLRAYNRRVKILNYLAIDAFPTADFTGNELAPPPSDPEAALHTRTFTREEFYALARALGGSRFPVLSELDPRWAGTIQKTDYGSTYSKWVFANWNSRVFREYVKSALVAVAGAGFNGMFFDFGAINYFAVQSVDNPMWTVMPPNCMRLSSTSLWYWLSLPGQVMDHYGPPPEVGALASLDPDALSAITDLEYCGTTGLPAEINSMAEAEAMILSFYAELRANSRLMLIWNGANGGAPRRNDIALVNSHGGHEEGFGMLAWTPEQILEELTMVKSFESKRKVFIGWIRESSTAGRIYSYVACMMAGGRNTYCEFSEQIPSIPEITLDPGSPRGGYVTLPAGETDLQRIAYKRTFQKAIMYLNPTYSDITADGITIPAKTGLVLPPPPRR